MRRLLLVLSLVAATLPVQAAADLPPEADRLLWCGSAFYWLAVDASDAGNDGEADEYQQWSDQLMDRAATLLAAVGLDVDGTNDQIELYTSRALEEMATPQAPYDVAVVCPGLVTP